MTLENQVCSLELAKKLKELGVKESCLFFYNAANYLQFVADVEGMEITHHEFTPAYTVAELGEMLRIGLDQLGKMTVLSVSKARDRALISRVMKGISKDEANDRAKMLSYLLENNLITL